jgi:hypothetical protein
MRRSPVLVWGITALRDHAFPALPARAFPRRRVVQRGHVRERSFQRQPREQRAPFVERQRRHVTAVDPQDVEDVIVRVALPSPGAGRLAVEHGIAHGKPRDGIDDRGIGPIQRQLVPRQQLHVGAVLERQDPDAVELPLENPFGSREALLRQRRGHGDEPGGKRLGHRSIGLSIYRSI